MDKECQLGLCNPFPTGAWALQGPLFVSARCCILDTNSVEN